MDVPAPDVAPAHRESHVLDDVEVVCTRAAIRVPLDTFGTVLDWSTAALAVSSLHRLARLPGEAMTLAAVLVTTAIGATVAAAGIALFARRDLRGA
jgi:hypothetical protein